MGGSAAGVDIHEELVQARSQLARKDAELKQFGFADVASLEVRSAEALEVTLNFKNNTPYFVRLQTPAHRSARGLHKGLGVSRTHADRRCGAAGGGTVPTAGTA